MPENALAKKMKLKRDLRAAVINAPDGYLKQLSPLPSGVELVEALRGKFDWVQVFFKNKAEVDKLLPKIVRALKPDGLVWLTFPKGTSKIQTDLTRDKGWDALQQTKLKWVTLISVNATRPASAYAHTKDARLTQRCYTQRSSLDHLSRVCPDCKLLLPRSKNILQRLKLQRAASPSAQPRLTQRV